MKYNDPYTSDVSLEIALRSGTNHLHEGGHEKRKGGGMVIGVGYP